MKILSALVLSSTGLVAGCGGASAPAPALQTGEHAAGELPKKRARSGRKPPRLYEYVPVPVNPDMHLPPGFGGEVHPELHGDARLELTARWRPTLQESKRHGIKLGIIDNREAPEYSIPDRLVKLLTESTPAVERATHAARDLSVFLPQELTEPGQMWTIDPEKAALFLRQFHPATSVTFDRYHQPYGRRPGPAGAFGILRALSPEYVDVVFRVHAEFVLEDGAALYTPACFLGHMLVDRAAGTVAALELSVPKELSVNVDITLTFPLQDRPGREVTNIVFERVDLMELVGGDRARFERGGGDGELGLEEAHARLKRAFYKFLDVAWVPAEDVLEVAGERHKPVLAVVLTSPLDDQSC